MKKIILLAALSLAAAPLWAAKPCDELKSEIEGKLKDKGVQGFTLDIVATADVKDAKVVGSCEAGSKKITYSRGAAPEAKPAAKPEAKPATKPEAKPEAKPAAK
jgi:hypothetical protein